MTLSNLFFGSLLVAAIASAPACGKKTDASCEAVFTHIRELTPGKMGEMLDQMKDAAIAKCETTPVEQRKCALAAKTIEELQACKQPK